MDKINGINALVSILRGQITRTTEKKIRSTSNKRAMEAKSKGKQSPKELDSLITSKINKLNCDKEEFQIETLKVIVESILAWEFGDEILTDPEFEVLVNNITDNIEASEKLSALYKEYFSNKRQTLPPTKP